MTEVIRNSKSFKATSSLASNQYCFVKLDTSGQIVISTDGANAIGVLQDKPGAGEPGSVCGVSDITKVQCGGSFSAGDLVSSDSSGKAISAGTGDYIMGQALTAGSSSTLATILFQPRGSVR